MISMDSAEEPVTEAPGTPGAPPADAPDKTTVCAKCGNEPASAKHPWGKACKAKYQREYTGTVMDVAERRGFLKGAEAMRAHLVAEFIKVPPTGLMQAGEVAAFIANTPPPQRADS